MLRLIFVLLIIVFGTTASLFSPFYALLFYLWNAYFRPDDWTYGGFIASLNLSFFVGGYLLLATVASMPRLRVSTRVILLAVFFIDSLICAIYSEHPSWSWNSWILFAKVLIITYIIVLLTTDRRRYRTVLTIIAISLGFECAKQAYAQLVIAPGAQNNNPSVFLGDNNGIAVGTMMLVPVIGALAQTAIRKWERVGYRFLLVGVFMRGITTYSRGGFLAASVLGIFAIARSPRKLRALIGATVLAGVVLTVMPDRFWERMNTINASDGERGDSAEGRLHFWYIARVMADAKPLTGVGFDGFSQSYQEYNGPDGEFPGVRAAHSVWFGLLADMGYPGLIVFVLLWGSSIWSCWRVSATCKGDPQRRDLRVYADALLTSLVAFAVGGTFLSSQYNEMVWHFIGLATTLSFLASEQPDQASAPLPEAIAVKPQRFAAALRGTAPTPWSPSSSR
jgi:probable O-glycosylation ligase (exosortase A-associated)